MKNCDSLLLAVTVFLKINKLVTCVRRDACNRLIMNNWFICRVLLANVLSIYFVCVCVGVSFLPFLLFHHLFFNLMYLIIKAVVAWS